MSGYYTYLVSSLPMLHFGTKPPFSFGKFLEICRGLISASDIDTLKISTIIEGGVDEKINPTLKKWHAFDTSLRNELVKIRALRKRLEPLKYIREGGYTDPSVAHIALHAYRSPSILEAEKILDQERWRFLEELAIGHYFDIEFLMVYANKLLILQRWEEINTLDKTRALEELLSNERKNHCSSTNSE